MPCPDYRDFVRREIANRTQLDVDELVEEFGKLGNKEEAIALLLGQADLARESNNHKWLQRSRDRGVGLAELEWLVRNLWRRKRSALEPQPALHTDIGLHVDPRLSASTGGPRWPGSLSPACTIRTS